MCNFHNRNLNYTILVTITSCIFRVIWDPAIFGTKRINSPHKIEIKPRC